MQSLFDDAEAQQQIYLQNANAGRDAAIDYLQNLVDAGIMSKKQLSRFVTVTAAWDGKTGQVFIGAKISVKGGPRVFEEGYYCAETMACAKANAAGVPASNLQYTETLSASDLYNAPYCLQCQTEIARNQVAWSRAKPQKSPEMTWSPDDLTAEQTNQMKADFLQSIGIVQDIDSNFDLTSLDNGSATPDSEAMDGGFFQDGDGG